MFRTFFLTLGLCVCVGPLTALAYDVVPMHAPASGPVDTRPVNLQLSSAYGGEPRSISLVSEPIWNKYSKRPSAYANTGIRTVDPALVLPVSAPARYKPSYAPSRKSKARTSRTKTSSVKVAPAPQPSAARSGNVAPAVPQRVTASAPPAAPAVPQKVMPQNSSPAKNTGSPAVAGGPPSVPAPTVSGTPSRGTANIYEESAPAVGVAPEPASDTQVAAVPRADAPGAAPLSPRKPSPVPSIAPDLAPNL